MGRKGEAETPHVPQYPCTARKKVVDDLLAHLEARFGPCKIERQDFIHTGIHHIRRPDGVYSHQFAYVEQLKPLTITRGSATDISVATGELAEAFYSLLGGVAWTVLTRGDVAVYVQALQRRGANPRVKDCYRLNMVLRYLKRHKVGLLFRKMDGELKLVGFTDAAFRAQVEESSGLALRGLAVVLTPECGDQLINSHGEVQVIDYVVRKLRRVVRSTFAGELNALLDSIETMIVIQMILYQLYYGAEESAEVMMEKLEAGALEPRIELAMDARSVFDALAALDVCTPQEASLKLHLIAIRDRIERQMISKIFWTDTRDMLADALTKGGIDRASIRSAMDRGIHKINHPVKAHCKIIRKYDPTVADRNNPFAHWPPGDPRWRPAIKALYWKFSPEKVSRLPELFKKYYGNEEAWYNAMLAEHTEARKVKENIPAISSCTHQEKSDSSAASCRAPQMNHKLPRPEKQREEEEKGQRKERQRTEEEEEGEEQRGRKRKEPANDKCRICGEKGHWQDQCPRIKKRKRLPRAARKQNQMSDANAQHEQTSSLAWGEGANDSRGHQDELRRNFTVRESTSSSAAGSEVEVVVKFKTKSLPTLEAPPWRKSASETVFERRTMNQSQSWKGR